MAAPSPMAVARPAGSDLARLRRDFPILRQSIHGHPLVYLDNAATAQKPRQVVEAEADFSVLENANVHRGVHTLSQRATSRYDGARERVRAFVNAAHSDEIILTAGTTAGINLIAQSFGGSVLRQGDEILLTEMEHHSNIVPWQLIAARTGARLRVLPVTDRGELDLSRLPGLLSARTRIVSVTHVSNVLGTLNPIAEIAALARAAGAVTVIDGAQAVPHLPVDVQALGVDFYVASGHKMYGPTGIGFLYGRRDLLDAMPPWQGGGGMIQRVSFEETSYAPLPARFEAGTPPIAQAVGLAAAIDYLSALDWAQLRGHEEALLAHAAERIAAIPGYRLVGTSPARVGALSFVLEGVHPHDVGTVLDLRGVAVRASHHCAQPLMRRFGISGTVRASFALYNTLDDVEALISGLQEVRRVFGG